MEDFQIYILQVNAGLVVFYLLYRMLFSRDTFLRIRRLFLFSIVILAFVYPLVSVDSLIRVKNRAVIMFRSLLCRRLQLLSLSSVGFLSIRPITKSGNFMRLSYTSLLMSANGIHWICYSGRYFVSFSGSIRLSGFYVKKSGRIWNF